MRSIWTVFAVNCPFLCVGIVLLTEAIVALQCTGPSCNGFCPFFLQIAAYLLLDFSDKMLIVLKVRCNDSKVFDDSVVVVILFFD